ncbi:MAG TPA: zinc ribbon domain-containing protein, partial [Vicinamibacteria bacterium]|nr:zinc ribbon domain-containing protein [Vicinamibacteria bacterium]
MALSCPACGQALSAGQQRCPSCGGVVAPAVEGALAPDPASVSPLGRGRGDAIRDIAGQRRRTWKDEVKDRVRNRRQQKRPGGPSRSAVTELPLFGETAAPAPAAAEAAAVPPALEPPPAERLSPGAPGVGSAAVLAEAPASIGERELLAPEPSSADLADLPLRPGPALAPPSARPVPAVDPPPDPARAAREAGRAAWDGPADPDREPLARDEDEWPLEPPPRGQEPAAVERPAFARERALAAAFDLALMLGTAAVVVYFAGRAARVSAAGLLPAWPWMLGYLAFLGLVYSGY